MVVEHKVSADDKQTLTALTNDGCGRDAADVAVYNQFGLPVCPLNHEVRVERIAESA